MTVGAGSPVAAPRIAIHQPNFLPRLKVLQKLASVDVWCVLDSVQYCSREWQNRTRIISAHGSRVGYWLSVPVHRPSGRSTQISDVRVLSTARVSQQVKRSLYFALHCADHWADVERLLDDMRDALAAPALTQLCVAATLAMLRLARREPRVVLASSLPVIGRSSALMAALCDHLHAGEYLADSGARNYLREADFNGLPVMWQDWREPPPPPTDLLSYRDVSAVNYLARAGCEAFRVHLQSGTFSPAQRDTRPSTPVGHGLA